MKVDEKIILVHHLRTVTCLTRNYAIMHRGKAAVFDGLSAEHLMYCHPLQPCILAKLFNLFLRHGHVPTQFGINYTIPVLKGSSSSYSKNLTTGDFRGISISPVLSKILEHCVLRRFELYILKHQIISSGSRNTLDAPMPFTLLNL